MKSLTHMEEGQIARVLQIKGSVSFHRWCQKIGLRINGIVEVRSIIPVVINRSGESEKSTILEVFVNGHMIRLNSEEARRLGVEPILSAETVAVRAAVCV